MRLRLPRSVDPLFLRELYTTVRPKAFGRVVYLAAAAVSGVVLVAALVTSGDGRSAATVGRALFHTYFVAAYALVSVVSAVLGAGAVARDVESGMLEALGLTHLSPARYLAGKLAALWLVLVALLAATAPAAAVPLAWGGVSPVELVTGMGILTVVAILGIATGVAVATRMVAARWSIAVAVAVAGPAAATSLALVLTLQRSAEVSWGVPSDGPFWFASIPLVGPSSETVVLAGLLPASVVAVVLGYLAVLAFDALAPVDGRPRRALVLWLVGALLAVVVDAAAARPYLTAASGRFFAALALLATGLLGLVALVTRLGPRPHAREATDRAVLRDAAGIVLLSGAGAALVAFVPALLSTPSDERPQTEALARVALHVWSFVVAMGGLAAALQVAVGRRRSARVAVLSAIGLVGLAGFLTDAVRPGASLLGASFAARLSPLYATWAISPDRTERLLEPAAFSLAVGLVAFAIGGAIAKARARAAAP